jgi:hypothetical protein
MMFSLALSSPVAGNSACKATFKLMKTFQVLHSSKYVTPCFDEPMTDRDMAKRVMDFMGDCKDTRIAYHAQLT